GGGSERRDGQGPDAGVRGGGVGEEDTRDGTGVVSLTRAGPVGEGRHLRQHNGGDRSPPRLRPRHGAAPGAAGRPGMPHRRRVMLLQPGGLNACLCTKLYAYALVAKKVKAAVAGANGYAGMTAVHLLARHPGVDLSQLTSRSYAGKPYSEVFPLLDLTGEFLSEPSVDGIDVIFSCLPHNVGAAKVGAWLDAGVRVIDMSADFRLHDQSLYPKWYRQPHPDPALLEKAVFGLPELHGAELAEARLVAVPGCYSTASILALVPMTRGILATCYFDLKGSPAELEDAYREFYADQPFTKVVDKTPATKIASHSNLCLVNVAAQGRKAVVTAALDNLVKGASGQGVECFNLAFGFDRTTALLGPVQWP